VNKLLPARQCEALCVGTWIKKVDSLSMLLEYLEKASTKSKKVLQNPEILRNMAIFADSQYFTS
jgi:hypothetical protein